MSLTDSLMMYLEEQDEKDFVPNVPEDGTLSEQEIASRFKIETKEQANYYIRKYKEIELAEAEISETADKELMRLSNHIDEWKANETNKLHYPKSFFAGLLQEYAEEQLRDSKKKSLTLPNGSLGFKKQKDEFKYDDKTLVEYLKDTPYAEKVVEVKINKNNLKKDISAVDGKAYIEGQLIPGIEIIARDSKFEVK